MDKGILWIVFLWLISMIILFGSKYIKEKRELKISNEGMKKYREKHFNGRFKW